MILEKKNIGGNAFLTEKIEYYPGFTSISGSELMNRMEKQAITYGAVIKTGEEVVNIERNEDVFEVNTNSNLFYGRTIVLSTGSTYRKLGILNEDN